MSKEVQAEIKSKKPKPRLEYKGIEENGKIHAAFDRMCEEAHENYPNAELLITIQRLKDPKSWEQIKAFHGTIREQVQGFHESNGTWKPLDKIKKELKEQFLEPEKEYYSDGSPVMLKIAHPEKKGVVYEWHKEVIPSLADLSKEQMTTFISDIIDHFWHKHGYSIIIEEKKRK